MPSCSAGSRCSIRAKRFASLLSGYTELNALTDAINRGAIYRFITSHGTTMNCAKRYAKHLSSAKSGRRKAKENHQTGSRAGKKESFKAFQKGRAISPIKLIDEQHETPEEPDQRLGDIVPVLRGRWTLWLPASATMHVCIFASEEAIWSNDVIGLETQEDHLAQHLAFVSQLEGLCASSGSGSEVEQARFLHRFSDRMWLIRHIRRRPGAGHKAD